MIINNKKVILYIEPKNQASHEPIIDALTIKMFNAYMEHTTRGAMNTKYQLIPGIYFMGVHTCVCGKYSANYDVLLKSGQITNSLCVHYLAEHRDEVPAEEFAKVAALESSDQLSLEDEAKLNSLMSIEFNGFSNKV